MLISAHTAGNVRKKKKKKIYNIILKQYAAEE